MPLLTKMVTDRAITGPLRLEAMTALAALIERRGIDLLLDLVSDPVPGVRGSAFTALARLEPYDVPVRAGGPGCRRRLDRARRNGHGARLVCRASRVSRG